jgi:hypothetical protein
MEKFQPGDLVRLNAAEGGRPLIVESVVGGGSHVLCRPTDAHGVMIQSAEKPRLLAVILLKKA